MGRRSSSGEEPEDPTGRSLILQVRTVFLGGRWERKVFEAESGMEVWKYMEHLETGSLGDAGVWDTLVIVAREETGL